MSNLGKCAKCNKTVYALEGFRFGPPTDQKPVHKGCFKCSAPDCNWQLNVGTYKSYDGKPYCSSHCPTMPRGGDATQAAATKAEMNFVPPGQGH